MGEERGHDRETPSQCLTDSVNPSVTGLPAETDETAQLFIGRWNRLVSDSNWGKGRVIHEWRDAMIDAGAEPTDYSDEAWARRVTGVSGQHVGRLRRVYQRFGDVYSNYAGLYWSHFFAASDWNDAEMWLEGAIQNDWSVSRMRRMRWETLGGIATELPADEQIVDRELDEDFEPALGEQPAPNESNSRGSVSQTDDDDEAIGIADRSSEPSSARGNRSDEDSASDVTGTDEFSESSEKTRPFADLPDLPEDLADAVEVFKLAILSHRSSRWRDVEAEDVVRSLDALKRLALAPLD